MTPLLLFYGVFFPIDQLPAVIRPIAWIMPLWHGVDANRSLALGSPDVAGVLGHTAYLVVAIVIGALLARRTFTKRLVV